MKISKPVRYVLAACSLALSAQAHAGSAPTQLLNKTITIDWGESSQTKRISDGSNVSTTGQFERIVYISSAGHVFARNSAKNGKFGGSQDRGPEQTAKGTSFNGTTMTAIGSGGGEVARRITTIFNPAFTSCTTSVTVGKLKEHAKMTGFDGAQYEMIQIVPGAASCSISEGNKFGG